MKNISPIIFKLQISFFTTLLNCLFCFFPIAPLLCSIGGFAGAYFFYRHKFIYLNQKPLFKESLFFTLINSFINAFIIAYLFTLIFFSTLGKPLEQAWLQIEFLENLIRKSSQFKWLFFFLSFILAFLSNSFGCFLVFKLGISKKRPSEEKLLEKLELKDLSKYLD